MGRSKRERNIKNNELNSKFMSEVKNGKLAYSIPILVNNILSPLTESFACKIPVTDLICLGQSFNRCQLSLWHLSRQYFPGDICLSEISQLSLI